MIFPSLEHAAAGWDVNTPAPIGCQLLHCVPTSLDRVQYIFESMPIAATWITAPVESIAIAGPVRKVPESIGWKPCHVIPPSLDQTRQMRLSVPRATAIIFLPSAETS